jgi:hypothetical protein
MRYKVVIPGMILNSGGETRVGEIYERGEFRITEFTFQRRLEKGWIVPVEEEKPPEPEPEPEIEEEPVVEEEGKPDLPEGTTWHSDEQEPKGPLRNGLDIKQYWLAAVKGGKKGKGRKCPGCQTVYTAKSELFECCLDG